ncbi:ABC transporter permease [Desulfosporosinus meridiei]|uniref:ABC-type transport system, involved in lipoprotein release, permease component n=1 Tax=Desulfosporosinus meridiei (strain ATCC BAA-275 / DSM 13257 / KCTC 12902 / NCIMB 13706 / S10) TaxID=768704 RepID=J7ILK5_DESMD|nr:FtsX-like permease family protein [Desulfosporosinus meridiei]AFQ42672.1 ABC-type transport system, involved in lipoprotein release, permease component [Desulfosporosinus meridiei DSM 13257]
MRLTNIALQNIRRRKTRSVLLMLSVIIGVASIIFLYTTTQAMKEDIANKLDQFGSNILILPETGQSLTFGGITVEAPSQIKELDMSYIPLMQTIKNKETLATIAPKLLVTTNLNDRDILLLGVDFPQELRLKKWWKVDGLEKKQIPNSGEVLLGRDLALSLGLASNQTITILGQPFKIAGVIQPTGSIENDQAVFMDLSVLQKLADRPNMISLIEAAALCYTCPIEEVTQQLRDKLPGTKVTALMSSLESREDTFNKFNLFAQSVAVIIVVTSSLVITMTMKASVEERTREIGIFRAIGFRKRHIIKIILAEAGSLSFLGGLIGYSLGMSMAVNFAAKLMKSQVPISWQSDLLLYTLCSSLLIGLLAGLPPAWRAAKLDPTESLRYL